MFNICFLTALVENRIINANLNLVHVENDVSFIRDEKYTGLESSQIKKN